MIISAKIIKNPQARRRCEICESEIQGPTLRLYGAAESGDQPYVCFLHPECTEYAHPKIIKAIDDSNRSKNYYKCTLMGNTNGAGTDIRLKWPACYYFKDNSD